MANILVILAVFSLRMPDVETFEAYQWTPRFTEPKDLQLTEPALALLTHASRHFDPLGVTQPAVDRVVARMKRQGLPVLYLHDRYNDNNPAWLYLYRDRKPTAFVGSDVGHIDLNLSSVRHAICLGGYFGQCERSTVTDVIRCWQRDAPDKDLRITQIVDGIFTVTEHVKYEDPFAGPIRSAFYDDLRKRHPKAVMSVQQILSLIRDQDQALLFLSRQLPPVPRDANVVLDFFGYTETLQSAGPEASTLTFAYRRSDRFLPFKPANPSPRPHSDRRLLQTTRPVRAGASRFPSR
ncbi:MAG: hypothetical protein RIK87_12335 [Fuerstiella sp.]